MSVDEAFELLAAAADFNSHCAPELKADQRERDTAGEAANDADAFEDEDEDDENADVDGCVDAECGGGNEGVLRAQGTQTTLHPLAAHRAVCKTMLELDRYAEKR